MKSLLKYFFFIILISCNHKGQDSGEKTISVSIPPFKYFVKTIGGKDFNVNIMVPAGANPHIYEPVPEQIASLRRSVAYISDGYLGFEMTWLDRFYETNKRMMKLSLGEKISLISPGEHSDNEMVEGADPHYWVSPKCALVMAAEVKSLLTELNPKNREYYEINYLDLVIKISEIDKKAEELFSRFRNRSFMIFHPTLGYLARDYGLNQLAVETEGKEPTPSTLKSFIDKAKSEDIKVIFVQKEYDIKNARAIAGEIGAVIRSIDPLSENWPDSVIDIIEALYNSFVEIEK